MLLPSIFGENLFDDFFDDVPFFDNRAENQIEKKLYGRHAHNVMKTDIKENDDGYELIVAELTVAGNITLHTCQVLIYRWEAEVHLVTETAPGVAVVRELGSKYHLAHLLIGTIRLGVVPEFLEVAAQWMLLDYLVAILDAPYLH